MADQNSQKHFEEVASGKRFAFGENWRRFLSLIDEDRIREAETSLVRMLGDGCLSGRTFLDVGCGSGLFSLAARRLGAMVHSFDYDPCSVECARELKRRYFPDDPSWRIQPGSVLDEGFLSRLGRFDVVCSWGVLHHTGRMWKALENVVPLVQDNGLLFIAIYNDQGKKSRRWLTVKKLYNRLPPALRFLVLVPAFWHLWWRRLLKDLLSGHPLRSWHRAEGNRGMSPWRDVVDWVGGYPFEVARPEQIFDFYRDRGFQLVRLTTQGGDLGCNEFVFLRR